MTTQLLRDLPLSSRLEVDGFVTRSIIEQRVELTLDVGFEKLKVFIEESTQKAYYDFWKNYPLERFYASLDVTILKPYVKKFGTIVVKLNNFFEKEYVEPTIVCERELSAQLRQHIQDMNDIGLKELCRSFLNDKTYRILFYSSPATEEHAYSFKGGLLAHTVMLMDWISTQLSMSLPRYYEAYQPSPLNVDLLKTAALFHDAGKMFAYSTQEGKVYKTNEGQFLGTTALSLDFLRTIKEKTNQLLADKDEIGIPDFLYLQLQHIVASCKGEFERGATVLPKTKEAEFFANLEKLESKITNYYDLERKQIAPGFTELFHREVYVAPYKQNSIDETGEIYFNETIDMETRENPTSSIDEPFSEGLDFESTNVEYATSDEGYGSFEFGPIEIPNWDIESDNLLMNNLNDSPFYDSVLIAKPLPIDDLKQESFINRSPSGGLRQVESELGSDNSYAAPVTPTTFKNPYVTPITSEDALSLQSTFVSPIMNIPSEWPETPSTPPVSEKAKAFPLQTESILGEKKQVFQNAIRESVAEEYHTPNINGQSQESVKVLKMPVAPKMPESTGTNLTVKTKKEVGKNKKIKTQETSVESGKQKPSPKREKKV